MTEKPKRPRDPNQLAKFIVGAVTGENEGDAAHSQPKVIRARAGGKVGGLARAQKLSPEQRSDIARLAAEARWKKS